MQLSFCALKGRFESCLLGYSERASALGELADLHCNTSFVGWYHPPQRRMLLCWKKRYTSSRYNNGRSVELVPKKLNAKLHPKRSGTYSGSLFYFQLPLLRIVQPSEIGRRATRGNRSDADELDNGHRVDGDGRWAT